MLNVSFYQHLSKTLAAVLMSLAIDTVEKLGAAKITSARAGLLFSRQISWQVAGEFLFSEEPLGGLGQSA